MFDANQETYIVLRSSCCMPHQLCIWKYSYVSLWFPMSLCSFKPIPHQLFEPPLNCNYSEVTLPWHHLVGPAHSTTNRSSLCRHALQALLATCLETVAGLWGHPNLYHPRVPFLEISRNGSSNNVPHKKCLIWSNILRMSLRPNSYCTLPSYHPHLQGRVITLVEELLAPFENAMLRKVMT